MKVVKVFGKALMSVAVIILGLVGAFGCPILSFWMGQAATEMLIAIWA